MARRRRRRRRDVEAIVIERVIFWLGVGCCLLWVLVDALTS